MASSGKVANYKHVNTPLIDRRGELPVLQAELPVLQKTGTFTNTVSFHLSDVRSDPHTCFTCRYSICQHSISITGNSNVVYSNTQLLSTVLYSGSHRETPEESARSADDSWECFTSYSGNIK